MIQIFGGGAHAGRRIDIQDFLIVPIGADSFDRAMVMTADVYAAAGRIMAARGALHGVADEGGWWPDFSSNADALDTLVAAIERAGLVPGTDAAIAIDVAASQLRKGSRYVLAAEQRELTGDELADMLLQWCRDLSHHLHRRSRSPKTMTTGMRAFTARAGERLQVIGDDYLVTSAARIAAAAQVEGVQRRAVEAESGRNGHGNGRGTGRRTCGGLEQHHLGAFGRNRGCDDRAPGHRVGRGPVEGRLVRARRTHGQMERSAAHRRSARRVGADSASRG